MLDYTEVYSTEDFYNDDDPRKVWSGYLFGLIETDINPFDTSEFQDVGDEFLSNGMCFANFSYVRKQVNLGSEISKVLKTEYGMFVEFSHGDPCGLFGSERYTSDIKLICDPAEGDGWPKMIREREQECHRSFEWNTSAICKQCTNKDVTFIHEECGMSAPDTQVILPVV